MLSLPYFDNFLFSHLCRNTLRYYEGTYVDVLRVIRGRTSVNIIVLRAGVAMEYGFPLLVGMRECGFAHVFTSCHLKFVLQVVENLMYKLGLGI